jgi:hypothetical protein
MGKDSTMTDRECPDPETLNGLQIWEHNYLYHRRHGIFTKEEEGTTMKDMYRITIERMNDADQWIPQTDIVCTSRYTLVRDIADWIQVEIDQHAIVRISAQAPCGQRIWGGYNDIDSGLRKHIDTCDECTEELERREAIAEIDEKRSR